MKLILSLIIGVFFICASTTETGVTSEAALQKLKDGNKRFVDNTRTYTNLNSERIIETTSNGQFPYATVITCSDSRVPVEHIFDVGIGDVFVIRVAGNVVNTDEAGSIEYGVEHLHTPILVVLGHTHCGAVTAVVKNADVQGNIPKLIENINPAVDKAKEKFGTGFTEALLEASIENNVYQSIEDLFHKSEITKHLVSKGELKVIGAIYELETGKVKWMGEHPKQQELIIH